MFVKHREIFCKLVISLEFISAWFKVSSFLILWTYCCVQRIITNCYACSSTALSSDFCKSFGLTKNSVNKYFIFEISNNYQNAFDGNWIKYHLCHFTQINAWGSTFLVIKIRRVDESHARRCCVNIWHRLHIDADV